MWLWRWIRDSLVVEGLNSLAGFLGFGNPIGLLISLAVGVAVGWWAAARSYAECIISPWGSLGYVVAILVVALLFVLLIGGAAFAVERITKALKARSGIGPPQDTDLLRHRRAAITQWYKMVDEVEEEYRSNQTFNNLVERIKQKPEYYRLEPLLSHDTKFEMMGLVIRSPSAMNLAFGETRSDNLLRLFRSDIARIEREWNLI